MAKAWNTDIDIKGKVLYNWSDGGCENELRLSEQSEVEKEPFDIAIIGAGVVGCAIAYKLSQYNVRLLLIDKNHDVGEGISKANSAIIHTGFDATPGSLESQLVVRASHQWPTVCHKLKISIKKTSAFVLAVNEEELNLLPKLLEKAHKNGVEDVEIISGAQAREQEKGISPNVMGALHVKRESIIDPFTTSIAFAEIAVVNGATLILGLEAKEISENSSGNKTILCTNGQQFNSKIVINAASFGSPPLGETYQAKKYDVNPRRGQFIIYDKQAFSKISRIILPVPNPKTKGILVTPTIFGNILAGPTAEDLPNEVTTQAETTAAGIAEIKEGAFKLWPQLNQEDVIGSYAGLRCNCKQSQYNIHFNDGKEGIVTLTGIRSTGLTSSIALADYIIEGLEKNCKLILHVNPLAIDSRPDDAKAGWDNPRPYENEDKLAKHPDYAEMVCFCEQISCREIIKSIASPLSPRTIDALRRRTRVATGRCQSFYCFTRIAEILSQQTNIPMDRISKKGPGSEIIV